MEVGGKKRCGGSDFKKSVQRMGSPEMTRLDTGRLGDVIYCQFVAGSGAVERNLA